MKQNRYERAGECARCGWCCLQEDPPCEYLKKEDDGKYTCMVFNDLTKRPLRCFVHPSSPPVPITECGYWFIDTRENNKVIKRIVN